jgi:hypothetical protein
MSNAPNPELSRQKPIPSACLAAAIAVAKSLHVLGSVLDAFLFGRAAW